MSVSWKQAPPSPEDETALVLETLQGLDVVIPAIVLAVLAGLVLLRRAVRPRRKGRRLDPVLPYATPSRNRRRRRQGSAGHLACGTIRPMLSS